MVGKTAYREGKPGDRQDPEEPGHTASPLRKQRANRKWARL